MNNQIRIPTLLGLGLLLLGLGAGVFLVNQNQIFQSQASQSAEPKNITLVNIGATQVSLFWQTDTETRGFIQAGTSPLLGLTFKDIRDTSNPLPHRLHFVTLTNLEPNTTYYYKINSGGQSYPNGRTSTFKTATSTTTASNPSLVGTVFNQSNQPTEEAIVMITLPGASPQATITKTSGNFVLPLSNLLKDDLNEGYTLPQEGIVGYLNVMGTDQSSKVTLKLPIDNPILPPLVLGQDLDITQITPSPTPSSEPEKPVSFDLNKDGIVNSLDLSVIRKNMDKKSFQKEADLNSDNKVNEEDLRLFSNLTKIPLPTSLPKRP